MKIIGDIKIFLSQLGELNQRVIFGILLVTVFGIPVLLGGIPFVGLLLFTSVFITAEYVSIKKQSSPVVLIYIFIVFTLLYLIRTSPFGLQKFVLLAFVIILFDTIAYFCGKTFGKHKLCPNISPGKTFEGLIGGVLGVVILSFPMHIILGVKVPMLVFAVIVGIVAIVSQIGDILESAFKRRNGVKDSSALIPGHGGFLDRFDGYIVTTPLFFISDLLFHLF